MKNSVKVILTVCFISLQIFSTAQPVKLCIAKEIAGNHMLSVGKGNLKSSGTKPVRYRFTHVDSAVQDKDTLYYVLNDTVNNSFVIVAADKRSWPVLAYSYDGTYNSVNQPPAFKEWMEERKKEIISIKRKNLQSDGKTIRQWEILSSESILNAESATSVEPLLQTKWNQGCYYNASCPVDIAGPCDHVVTGCVATSMAQIMKYWNYPATGTGSHTYSQSGYGSLTADFNATTYQWSQMPNNVTSQNDAVATLMFHCGVSVDMEYGPNSSGAYLLQSALVDYFKYSPNARYVNRGDMTEGEWSDLLKTELNANRPIWYRGDGPGGGHAFVCDGYQNTDYFHFNWGWGGYEDGYYYLESMDYNTNQAAIIEISPADLPDGFNGYFLNANTLSLGAYGQADSVKILSSVNWSAFSSQSWLTLSQGTGVPGTTSLILTASENNTGSIRFAEVIISAIGFNSQTIKIYQPSKVQITPGGLANALAGVLNSTTSLTLSGTIDARDFKTMRDKMPLLTKIDLLNVKIVAYTGTEGTYDTSSLTYAADEIPRYAFYDYTTNTSKSGLISVVFPSSVTSVGNYAFYRCTGLSAITIPSQVVSIVSCAFSGINAWITVDENNPNFSSYEGVLFNKTKTELIQCPVSKTGNFTIPSSVTSIGVYAFNSCSKLTEISIPLSVKSIDVGAFSGCKGFVDISIPASVISIGSCAFYAINAWINVEENNTNYSSFEGVLFNKNKTILMQCPESKTGIYTIPSSVTSIGCNSFSGCSGLTSVSIPSSVTTIGDLAFMCCTGLTEITIPYSVISIGANAFSSCRRVTKIVIPSSVSSIGSRAFSNCTGLIAIYANPIYPVNLSSSVSVFNGINKTTCKLYVPRGSSGLYAAADQWKEFVNIEEMPGLFVSANSLKLSADPDTTSITISSSASWIITSDQEWLVVSPVSGNQGIYEINISATTNPNIGFRTAIITITANDLSSQTVTVTQYGKTEVTAGGLKTLLGSNLGTISSLYLVGTIDARDFKTMRDEMPLLTNIDLLSTTIVGYAGTEGTYGNSFWGYSANTIPVRAFYNPNTNLGKISLVSVILPSSATTIGGQAFNNCTGLKSIHFSPLVYLVGDFAFYGCSGMASVYIPESVIFILECAFSYCTGLFEVDANNPNYSGNEGVLFNKSQTTLIQCPISKTGTYTIPSNVTSIGKYAFYGCKYLISINLPQSVTSIGQGAFTLCSGLTSVSIPSSVTSIEKNAFYNCTGLSSIYAYPISPVNLGIGIDVFYNVNKITCKLFVPSGSINLYANAYQWKDFVNIVEIPKPEISLSSLNIGSIGGSKASVKVTSNTAWTATSDKTWLTVSPTAWTGNATLVVTASANPLDTERVAIVKISADGVSFVSLQVTQLSAFDVLQEITLVKGWNIFSVNLIPDNPDMQTIFAPLINHGYLIKIQDEVGNALENLGTFGGWVNNIGNIYQSEGYKIKVSQDCQLQLKGSPVTLPFKIPLKAGWNIIGYPRNSNTDAKEVVQHLIDRGKLIKVQNETGNSIEDMGFFGGWINNIGSFMPGEGYKIKVSASDTLTINESYPKAGTSGLSRAISTGHFHSVRGGYGVDHMNINLVMLPNNVIVPGDEIGVFDDVLRVGAVNLSQRNLSDQVVSIPVSLSDDDDKSGFIEGNPFSLKIWKAVNGIEHRIEPMIIQVSTNF
jgi:hypothetical protein